MTKTERARAQKLLDLAESYEIACALVQPAWVALLKEYPDGAEREAAARFYRACREAVIARREELLDFARGDHDEVPR